jgi:hypothetical protein
MDGIPLIGGVACPTCGGSLGLLDVEVYCRLRGLAGEWVRCGRCGRQFRLMWHSTRPALAGSMRRRAEIRSMRRMMLRIAKRTADPEVAEIASAAARGFGRWLEGDGR